MKLNIQESIVEHNIEEVGDITLTSESHKHIFNMLTNYSDPLGTVLREYTSNALDACVENGNASEPVIVSYKKSTKLLIISDNGIGMSKDRIDNVFKKMFISTKQNSNDYIGAFGIGSKSAFGYTNSFHIKTRYDGIERTYELYKTATTPKIVLVNEIETDLASGTDIIIPIKQGDETLLYDKIISQLYFFKNVYYADDLAHINDRIKFKEYNNFYYVTNHNIKSKVTISYGPVSYNIEDANLLTQISNKWERYTIDLYNKLTNDYPFLKCARYSSTPLNIIPIIPIGELDIIWTRENIQYSDKSKKVILDTFDTVFEYMVANYKDKYIFDVFNFIVSIPKVHATYNKKFKTINLNKDQKHYDLEDIDTYATIIDESLASSAGNFLNVVRSIVRNKVVTDYNKTIGYYTKPLRKEQRKFITEHLIPDSGLIYSSLTAIRDSVQYNFDKLKGASSAENNFFDYMIEYYFSKKEFFKDVDEYVKSNQVAIDKYNQDIDEYKQKKYSCKYKHDDSYNVGNKLIDIKNNELETDGYIRTVLSNCKVIMVIPLNNYQDVIDTYYRYCLEKKIFILGVPQELYDLNIPSIKIGYSDKTLPVIQFTQAIHERYKQRWLEYKRLQYKANMTADVRKLYFKLDKYTYRDNDELSSIDMKPQYINYNHVPDIHYRYMYGTFSNDACAYITQKNDLYLHYHPLMRNKDKRLFPISFLPKSIDLLLRLMEYKKIKEQEHLINIE